MQIGICDDEKAVCRYLQSLIRKYMEQEPFEIIEFFTGGELLAYLSEQKGPALDILFLDVALADMDGITVAKKLREQMEAEKRAAWGSLPLLIFVTGFSEYMPSAFSVHAFQYIMKPVQEQNFYQVLAQAVRECKHLKTENPKELLIKTNNQMRKISVADIYYIESSNRKVILNLQNETLEFYDKISSLEQQLWPDFFRIHKGYLVHMKYVERYNRSEVCMKNGDRLLISKYKYHDFVAAYIQYIARKD